jgi:hypothetical protein
MALITGTPLGTIIAQDEIYIEGAPYIYYQDSNAPLLFNPDANGFYWGLSGTAQYPVYELVCYEDVALSEDLEINAIRCDRIGDSAVIQKRNHLEFTLSLSTLFPLSTSSPIMKGSAVTVAGALEKMGLGPINNNQFWHFYMPKVYDEATGDYLSITIPRGQFADAFNIAMVSGDKWMLGGITIWGLADFTKPSAQTFATIIRADPSAIP